MVETVPNPGSDEAIEQGCICPIIDNGHGRRPDGRFVYVVGCPVHPSFGGDYDHVGSIALGEPQPAQNRTGSAGMQGR